MRLPGGRAGGPDIDLARLPIQTAGGQPAPLVTWLIRHEGPGRRKEDDYNSASTV